VDLMMARVRRQLESQALELMLTDQAKELLANRGYDPQLGARPTGQVLIGLESLLRPARGPKWD
jgi:ATP-dependent Clp protease ATP-binding subunit ClpA